MESQQEQLSETIESIKKIIDDGINNLSLKNLKNSARIGELLIATLTAFLNNKNEENTEVTVENQYRRLIGIIASMITRIDDDGSRMQRELTALLMREVYILDEEYENAAEVQLYLDMLTKKL